MVVRFKTGPGGTVGPQGAADYLVPTKDRTRPEVGEAISGSRVNVVPWGPEAEPFALYNFELDGATDLAGRGTSGNNFRAIKTGSYWDNSNYASLYANTPPFYSSLSDFGGSMCGAPVTAIIQTENSGGVTEAQWVMTDDDTWGGIAINTQVDAGAGSPYISMQISWTGIGVSPPSYSTNAYWDLSAATLTASNLFILTLNPASTSHSLLINGTAFTSGTSHTNNVPGCSTLDGGVYPALAKTDVFNASDIVGMAWTRGAADHAFWSAYDWTTETGFAP